MVKTVPRAVRFPSPYGEEVLKVERLKDSTRRVSQVSVPLRGRGFESLGSHQPLYDSKDSVFPSPYGEEVLKEDLRPSL